MAGCLFYSLYNLSIFLCYSESKYVLVYSILGINKFKYDSFFYFYFSLGFFFLFHTFYYGPFNSYKLLISLLSRSL